MLFINVLKLREGKIMQNFDSLEGPLTFSNSPQILGVTILQGTERLLG